MRGKKLRRILLLTAFAFVSISAFSACDFLPSTDGGKTDEPPKEEQCQHVLIFVEGKESTCSEAGYSSSMYCELCGEIVSPVVAHEKLPHREEIDEEVPATCTQTGLTEGKHCRDCAEIIIAQEVTEKLPHAYEWWYDEAEHYQKCDCGEKTQRNTHAMDANACLVCPMRVTEGLSYELSEDKTYYTVTGIGKATATDIVIPSTYQNKPVKAVAKEAFWSNYDLTSIVIGDGITTIEEKAFDNCYYVTRLVLGKSVTRIEKWAFQDCANLTDITVNGAVEYIGQEAFQINGPNGLWEWDYEGGYKYFNRYDNGCYLGNEENPYVVFMTAWETGISGKDDLTECNIHEDTKIIYTNAFAPCESLLSIEIPNGVRQLGEYAFGYCKKLEKIEIPTSVKAIDGHAFIKCNSLTEFVIPDTVTEVGNFIFRECIGLKCVTVGKGISDYDTDSDYGDYEDYEMFYKCSALERVIFRGGLTEIRTEFNECYSLKSIVILASVTKISAHAFKYCSIQEVFYGGTESMWDDIKISQYDNDSVKTAKRYYYRETQPNISGYFWRYVDGVPTVWE